MTLQPPTLPSEDHPVAYDRRPFERLLRVNAAGLARLADPDDDADRELVLELLETSCLFELARLASAPLDLVTHLQLAADVLTELFPATGCSIELSPPGLDPVAVASGVPPTPPCVDQVLLLGGVEAGHLRVGPLRVELRPTEFFTQAAEQLSTGVATVVAAERLRRQASVAASHQAASSLDATDVERGLRRLVQALAAWPGVVAARLEVDHPAAGVPLALAAGWWDGEGPHVDVPAERVGVRLWLRRAGRGAGEGPTSEPGLEAVIGEVERSLDRIDRERRLARESETDPLTGVGNRRRLHVVLGSGLHRAQRQGERLAVLALDLDHFKRVNDTLGHEVGDTVLVAAAAAVRALLAPWDELVRSGGEEFIVVSPSCDVIQGRQLAERILVAVPASCATVLPSGLRQHISVGLAVFPDMASDAHSLLRLADGALYRAKRTGRNTLSVAQPGDAVAHVEDDPAPGADDPHDTLERWAVGLLDPAGHGPADGPGELDDGAAATTRRVLQRVRRSLRGSRPAS